MYEKIKLLTLIFPVLFFIFFLKNTFICMSLGISSFDEENCPA